MDFSEQNILGEGEKKMDNASVIMMTWFIILVIVYAIGIIALHRLYLSKIYSLYWINKRSEQIVSIFIAFILAGLTLILWYVVDLIIIIVAIILWKKHPNKKILIAVVTSILLAVASIAGISLHSSMKDQDSDVTSQSLAEINDDVQEYYDEEDEFDGEDWSDEEDELDDEDWSDGSDDLDDEDWSDEEDELDEEDGADEEDELEEENLENNDDMFPLSSSTYLVMSDLEGLTKEECRIGRNEIYARHGRLFTDEFLQDYFNSKDWYEGYIEPEDFDETMLNEYEISNRDLIVEYETEMGYR